MVNGHVSATPSPTVALARAAVILTLLALAGFPRPATVAGQAADDNGGKPLQAPRQHSTDELIAAVDKAFAGPPDKLKPAVLIFPAVDADNRIHADGSAISNLALFASTYTPRRRLATCVPYFQEILAEARCSHPGEVIGRQMITLCCKATETDLYVVPHVETTKDHGQRLTVAFHGDGKTYHDRTFRHTLPAGQLRTAPGLIARDVLEHLGVRLTREELTEVITPQVQTDADLDRLNAYWIGTAEFGEGDADIKVFVRRNPRCVHAWEMYLSHTQTPVETLGDFRAVRPPLECDRLQITAAARFRELDRAEDALLLLLPLAASHRDDAWYHMTLTKCGAQLEDERLTEHLLALWRREEPGYAGGVMRGQMLTRWAWQARGRGWAFAVTPEGWRLFETRLQRARRELEQAVKRNPSGWEAHAALVTVAMGLDLPRAFMEEHFEQAVRLVPRYQTAYSAKLMYLKPRWHGSPAEMLAFGRQCLETRFWQDGIPQLMLEVVEDFGLDPETGATLFDSYRSPALWRAITDYYREAMHYGEPADRKKALNYLAKWAVCGEHYDGAVVAFQKLADSDRFDLQVWGDENLYLYFRRLVYAKTGRLPTGMSGYKSDRALAAAEVALAAGDLDVAARQLARVRRSGDYASQEPQSYYRAIQLCRRLRKEKNLDLTPEEIRAAFTGVERTWRVDGNRFVCDLAPGGRAEIRFPVGLKHAVISGTLEWSPSVADAQVIAHTRALRDPVAIIYLPDYQRVQVLRNLVWIAKDPLPPGSQHFRLEFRGDMDRLQPYPEVTRTTAVHEDVPSGFGFQADTQDRPGTFAISDLHIELLQD